MLDRIEIRGFKSIREADLGLRSLNVLIGANGAGKSNLISIFALLRRIVEGRLQEYVGAAGGADALLRFGQKETRELSVALKFLRGGAYRLALAPSQSNSLYFVDEGWHTPNGAKAALSVGPMPGGVPGAAESSLLAYRETSASSVSRETIDILDSIRVYHFQDTSRSARVKGIGDLGDNEALREDAANLAAFLYLLQVKHPAEYRRIVATIRLAAPFFDDFRLRPTPLNEQKIQLEWRERSSDAYFNAHSLSDGTLRFICLATLLLQPDLPSIVIVDEPEIGLHPYAITVLAGLLRGAATKTQVLVSTQSVTLVNQFTPEDVIVVDRRDGQSTFRRLSEEDMREWLDDYGVGDLWEKNIIGGRPA